MSDNGKLDVRKLPIREEMFTLFDMFMQSVVNYSNNIAFIYRIGKQEHRVSYAKLFEDVLLLSKALRKRGVSRGDKVMLLSDNRYAWIVTDLAMMSFGAVNVPRGSDTPTPELEFIVEHSESKYLIAETPKLLEIHNDFVKKCRRLKGLFVMEGPEIHKMFSNTYSYQDILSCREYTDRDVDAFIEEGYKTEPDDLLTLIYTSGTTGMPKGVQLSHKNIMHNVSCVPDMIRLTEEDSWLSLLPSWHIFERTAEYVGLSRGTTLVYSSVKTFAQDLEKYKPTLVATVPRVWESLYSKVQAGVRKRGNGAYRVFSALLWGSVVYRKNKRKFFDRMPVFQKPGGFELFWTKACSLCKLILVYPLYKLADKKLAAVRQRFGGNLRLAISGGGSLARYLEEWIDAVGIRIVNAYGMTECSPAIAGRGLDCRVYGTVGPGVADTTIRIVNEDGDEVEQGEEGLIEVFGDQVTAGYYKNEEENQKSFTEDGFFRTGDLGRITITGDLVVTGRAKDIIVLSSGENIDPTNIESTISVFPFIQDAVLVGQDKKGLGALLVADKEQLVKYVNSKITDLRDSGEELLKNSTVLEQIRKDINERLKPKEGFKPYEKLQNITFLDREFTLGEELTNTFKKKRHVIEKKYRKIINDLLR